ncbi:MAG: 23S rRNA (adenine(2503)-C(2))-methyltransferase RlmN [Myxococcales bacterium]|nr:23S rRNA (adenine(2503)-C(2))-methyltransferase RlmN [Myxococcales bacterium]
MADQNESGGRAGAEPEPFGLLPAQWDARLSQWGQPRYRTEQILRWLHERGVFEPEAMSDLPKSLRTRLAEAGLRAPSRLASEHLSSDGTRKLLLELGDGRRVESVLIPREAVSERDIYAAPDDAEPPDAEEAKRPRVYTQCISSQVGCAMGCGFCASGIAGLKRNMSAAEIASQVALARGLLGQEGRLAGVVLMGMGEPLHNYDAVSQALELLADPRAMGISPRRVTVSTSGLVDGIDRLGRDFQGKVGLAVSVHAPSDAIRDRIMPINRRHPLDELMAALRRYPLPARRRITIEYTLIDGINDADEHARALSERLRELRVKVNLIPMNAVPGSQWRAPTAARVDRFQKLLRERGLDVFVRKRRGDDIAAACGQLALHGETRKVRTAPGEGR